jgi:hypothetical protein
VEHITVLPLTLVEREHLARVTMAVPAMIAVMRVTLLEQAGAAARERLVLLDLLVVLAPEEQVYSTVSPVRPYITQAVVAVVGRILERGLVDSVAEGPEDGATIAERRKQELRARLILAVVVVVVGVALLTARAARAAPASSLSAIRSSPRRR